MADITMIKPPRIAVQASTLDSSRVVGPQRRDAATPGAPIGKPPLAPPPRQKRAGQFGAPTGVVIADRGGPRTGPMPAQSLRLLESLIGNLGNYCASVPNARGAVQAVESVRVLVEAIAAGRDISDAPTPQPAPAPAPTTPPAPTK